MGRWLGTAWTASAVLLLAGCATGPLFENPVLLRTERPVPQGNPVFIPQMQGPESYARVFDKVLDVVDDFFDIAYYDRYNGYIETHPMTAPGLEQPWKPGSPDFYQRLLAFLQSIRHRAIVQITTAEDGGYWVEVRVLKELEDAPQPLRATAGQATFRMNSTVERQFEVIEPALFDTKWIPIGRDAKLEQVILERLAHFDPTPPAKPAANCPPAGQ